MKTQVKKLKNATCEGKKRKNFCFTYIWMSDDNSLFMLKSQDWKLRQTAANHASYTPGKFYTSGLHQTWYSQPRFQVRNISDRTWRPARLNPSQFTKSYFYLCQSPGLIIYSNVKARHCHQPKSGHIYILIKTDTVCLCLWSCEGL